MKLRFSWLFVCIFILIFGNGCRYAIKKPKPIDNIEKERIYEGSSGVYHSNVLGGRNNASTPFHQYTVDIVAQLCFARSSEGLTPVNCKNLAKRPEWKPFITWVDNE